MPGMLRPIQRFFSNNKPIPAGLYHYKAPQHDPRNYQLHLRIEENGDGLLIINASTVLHLNLTAAEYAYYLICSKSEEEIARLMVTRYQVDHDQALQDYRNFSDRIHTIIETPDLDPVTFLDVDRLQPFSGRLTAPYRLDCALTYRLPEDENPELELIERVSRELTTEDWKTIMQKAWDAGIPHILFTGGEPTLRDDLPELIRFAERTGQVTGLLSYGSKLVDSSYFSELLQSGLDHLMLILRSDNESSWKSVQSSIAEDLSLTVHLTIDHENKGDSEAILRRLAKIGIVNVSLSAVDDSLAEYLQSARSWVAALGLELIWNLPAPYSSLHPIALENKDAGIEGAGRAWIYVEPDGDVRPSQGNPKILGNILTDPWNKIWKG